MTDSAQGTWNDWIGSDVVASDGDKIGKLDEIYMDRGTGQPEWLAVKTGLFGMNNTFVPVEGAGSDGDALRVPFEKDFVKDAPNVDPDDGRLTEQQEAELYGYYNRNDYREWDENETDFSEQAPQTRDDDAEMTRSEEELAVGTRSKEAGRVRLHKYVVTENVTTTVPVRKEKVRVVREDVTDANRGDGNDITEDDLEMTLTEEEVVVDKRTVEKERVHLEKDVEVEDREVTDEVRKERVEVEGDVENS